MVSRQFRRSILNVVQMCQRPNIERLKRVQLTNKRFLLLSVSVAHGNQSENQYFHISFSTLFRFNEKKGLRVKLARRS
jgi:hypothetical protein